MPETTAPQRLQTSFSCEDVVLDASNVLLPKKQLFRDRSDQMADFDTRMCAEIG